MRWALCGAAALLVASAFPGCNQVRCDDKGEAAMQAVLPHLGQDVLSNLVGEASLCIADSLSDPVVPQFYTPTIEKAPVAHSLTVVPASEFSMGMGATIVVRTRGTSAPYMAVRVSGSVWLWIVLVGGIRVRKTRRRFRKRQPRLGHGGGRHQCRAGRQTYRRGAAVRTTAEISVNGSRSSRASL